MGKKIPDAVIREIELDVFEADQDGRELSLDKYYETLRRRHKAKGKQTPIGRTKLSYVIKDAKGKINQISPRDPPWNDSPLNWRPEEYVFLLKLSHMIALTKLIIYDGNTGFGWDLTAYEWAPVGPYLTNREAKWGAKLHAALADAHILVSYWILRTLALREIHTERTTKLGDKTLVEISDITAYLSFKPWLSAELAKTYRIVLDAGIITPLDTSGGPAEAIFVEPNTDCPTGL